MQGKAKIITGQTPYELYRRALVAGVITALLAFVLSITLAHAAGPMILTPTSGGEVTQSRLDSNVEVISGSSSKMKLEVSDVSAYGTT